VVIGGKLRNPEKTEQAVGGLLLQMVATIKASR